MSADRLPASLVDGRVESRAEAIERGAKRYMSGKPCPAGHNGLRDTLLGECCECRKVWRREQKQRDRNRLQQKGSIES